MLDLNHTGRELELMLNGRKPLSMFYAMARELPDEELIPERAFSQYVEAGRFVRDEETYQSEHPESREHLPVRYVFFALKDEEWRIPAMKLVVEASRRIGRWDEGIERLYGALLGYTEDEIDAWCDHIFMKSGV